MPSLTALALIAVLVTGCGGSDSAASGEPPPAEETIEERGKIGAVQTGDGLEVSIDALRITDASTMVDMDPSTAEIDTEPLAAGQEFLVLEVTIANVSSVAKEYNALSWSAADPDSGEALQAALWAVTGYDLTAGDLDPGEDRSGEVVIAIPADASKLRVSYDTQLFSQGVRLNWDIAIP